MKASLLGFMPDSDPSTPGVVTACTSVVPSIRGLKGAPSAVSTTLPALAAACFGAATVRKLDDSRRLFAGTATKLYESATTSWTDVSRAGAYNASIDIRWRFAQFSDVSLAVNKGDVLQFSAGSGVFADLTAPKASIVETVNQFVFLFDTNEATFGDSPNRWWCCALGDYTNWVPSVPNQCASGILVGSSGRITAGRRFGDAIIAYKQRAMYLGIYQGPPSVWGFIQLPGTAGALCQEAVIDVGTSENPRHIFVGEDDFYSFDGSRAVPLGTGVVKEYFFSGLSNSFPNRVCSMLNRRLSLVYFYYASSGGVIDKCLVFNYKTGRWGSDDRSIEAAVEFISGGYTYDSLGTYYSTYDDMPNITYDSPFWVAGAQSPAIIDTTHKIQTLTGAAGASSLTTGDIGDDKQVFFVSRVKPKYLTQPTTASLTNYSKMSIGDAPTLESVTTISSNRFDFMKSARWHRFMHQSVGDFEFNELDIDAVPEGSE